MPDDGGVLLDILGAAQSALKFRGRMGKRAFMRDAKTQSAVLHQLMILGEATKRLSEGFRKGHPAVPWRMISGMRNALIHEYGAVDLEEVWRTLEKDIPALIAYVRPLVPARRGKAGRS